jgi:hypothetical protein
VRRPPQRLREECRGSRLVIPMGKGLNPNGRDNARQHHRRRRLPARGSNVTDDPQDPETSLNADLSARLSRIVGLDPDTGEIHEVDHACPNCQAMEDIVKGAERDIRAWRARYANLAREKDEEARTHMSCGRAVELFAFWKKRREARPVVAGPVLESCTRSCRRTATRCASSRSSGRRSTRGSRRGRTGRRSARRLVVVFKDRERFEEHVQGAAGRARASR